MQSNEVDTRKSEPFKERYGGNRVCAVIPIVTSISLRESHEQAMVKKIGRDGRMDSVENEIVMVDLSQLESAAKSARPR